MVTLKWSLVFDKMTSLLQGCAVTMEISVLTLIFGTILGVVIYFGLPNLGITFSAMTAGVLSMSLNTGAYIAEIVRSGIHAIDPGQREAAKALGMPWHLEMLRIVAPQATKICILPLVNQFIATIKNTSILSAITLTETTIFTQIAGVLERRMA